MTVDDGLVVCITAKTRVSDDVKRDDYPLFLYFDSVINCLLHDSSFADKAFAIFDKFKSQYS